MYKGCSVNAGNLYGAYTEFLYAASVVCTESVGNLWDIYTEFLLMSY